MFNEFGNIFEQFARSQNLYHHMGNEQGHQSAPQRNNNVPPPASRKAINKLHTVQVTADDLLEETNKECLICLTEHSVGSFSVKLPCGHLFHKDCLTEWLVKQCTCPVCRYELETEDGQYENERKKRMNTRKQRLRKDELKSKNVAQLKEICAQYHISTLNCIDKQDIIDRIASSGKVVITENAPPVEFFERDFQQKNVAELKHLLLTFGLSCEDALEKSDLRNRLLESGRIILISNPPSPSEASSAPSDWSSKKAEEKKSANTTNNAPSISPEELKTMSLSGLRELCKKYSIDISNCLDKSDVIEAVVRSKKLIIKTAVESDQKGIKTFFFID
jgi:hypothetical protein